MSDRYSQLVRLPVAGGSRKRVGLPQPVDARARRRARSAAACCSAAPGAWPKPPRACWLRWASTPRRRWTTRSAPRPRPAGLDAAVFNPEAPADQRFKALVFDATGITSSERARRAAALLLPDRRRACCRPASRDRARRRAPRAWRASRARWARRSAAARRSTSSTSRRAPRTGSARRCGSSSRRARPTSPGRSCTSVRGAEAPLAGRTALVTGASRGIGASIATVLEREGASVVPARISKDADLELDITAPDTPAVLAERFADGLDVLVHNAGVTKDRTLAKMPEDRWQSLMEVNLLAPERITAALLPRAERRRADRLRLLDERDRRQRRPDELRDLQGRAPGPGDRTSSSSAGSRSTRSRPGSSRRR